MSTLDWSLFGAYLALTLFLGWRASRVGRTAAGHFVADRSAGWLVVGLSVMATQASAITFIGTTGKAYADGMGFAQFYLGLPVAMLILAYTLLPAYRRAGVFTAYEWLGRRFDERTRLLTAVLFLVSRGLALGVVIYAPSVVLSLLLGWDLGPTVAVMTVVSVAYTSVGGLRAVLLTDVVQMVLILGGLGLCLWRMTGLFPEGVDLSDALTLAGQTGRTTVLDWSWDPSTRYTVWSGLLGGTFLFLAYFGCDQSQVQRLLATRDTGAARRALALNALAKVPLQLYVLVVGVALFVAFHFAGPPLLFDGQGRETILEAGAGDELTLLERDHAEALGDRETAARRLLSDPDDAVAASVYRLADARIADLRAEAAELVHRSGDTDYDDTNHVFPYFLITWLPAGLVGLLVAALFAAAMSSVDSELNALATTSVVDLWAPLRGRDPEGHGAVVASRWFTVLWGGLAGLFALQSAALGSAIEAVNAIGSMFYGSLLGVFVLALADRKATGAGAFWGLLAGMAAVGLSTGTGLELIGIETEFELSWLWRNPLGTGVVVLVGAQVSRLPRRGP